MTGYVRPVCYDIACGLGGWAEGFLAEGYRVVGFDIVAHDYGTGGYPGELILRDIRSIHGSQLKDAAVIVASPPCTEYSYMAMPWARAKQIAKALHREAAFPPNYRGSRTVAQLNELFDACFRIQREASEAADRYIPLIIENVRGAQKWVGRARWSFGPYLLWGDVPALMPRFEGKKGFADFKGFKDFHDCEAARKWSSRDPRRKKWSAEIAKIPFPLAQHIARCFYPAEVQP